MLRKSLTFLVASLVVFRLETLMSPSGGHNNFVLTRMSSNRVLYIRVP